MGKQFLEAMEQTNEEKKLVVVLGSNYDGDLTEELDPPTTPAVFFTKDDPYVFELEIIDYGREAEQIKKIAERKPWVVVNHCDGAPDEKRAGIEVIYELEKNNLPYTGAHDHFYAITKREMKETADRLGISHPKYKFVMSLEELAGLDLSDFKFPVIVKHHNGYGSIGLHKRNLCSTIDEVREVAKEVIERFEGAVIEEYIAPHEYTVLVLESLEDDGEPIVLCPFECVFTTEIGFKTFEVKFIDLEAVRWQPVKDPVLIKKLTKASREIFKGVKANSYGRVDFRGDADGNLYFLEINSNCGVFFTEEELWGCADHIIAKDENFTHKTFAEHLFTLARKDSSRYNKRSGS
eukprot:TRINITY_DN1887_c0_g3_i2.p1 TRINITY_DN1887_c0_g3~~TRINITY_DN1887_c0_g3_i2.p1  ORF type:complete len:350 (+),score=63.41 TRINITY_DN1887_c0_g3_i2:40-1089(+)